MTRRARFLIGCTALVAGCAGGSEAPPGVSVDEIAHHVSVLAADSLLGRGTGQVGGERAARYIAREMEAYGLEAPAGSYFQPVPMIGNAPDASSASLRFQGRGGVVSATYLDDFVLNPGDPEATAVTAEGEVVFVGYGVDAPEAGWDDFQGMDVAGKFVLMLVNDPPATPEEPELFGARAMTYYGRWTYKYEEAARQGALGALIVHETVPAGYPWSVVRGGFSGEQFALPPDPDQPRAPALIGWVSLETARAALGAAGLDFDELKARAGRRGFRAVSTGLTVRGNVTAVVRHVDTENVAGLLPGATRADETIVVMAHYDGFGIGEPVAGDSIYNGAYDNASGTAQMLAIAGALARRGSRLDRSVLFVAIAAEEQGLLGSEWYAQSPLRPLDRTVAVLNFDEASVWGVTSDVEAIGEDRSELGTYLRREAQALGIEIRPESDPEVGTFFRSDHFALAKAGVPSLYLKHGRRFTGRPAGWGDSVRTEYMERHYHAPSDEIGSDWTYDGVARDGDLALRTIVELASSSAWPNWHEGQEFKAARDAMTAVR